MSLEKATAIVLRVVHWSESSYVLTLFTRELGKISAVAKGARRPKGPFDAALDLLALCKVVFVRKTSGALDVLTEAKLVRCFRVRALGLGALNAGYYVAELLNELTDEYDPHPVLFDVAEAALLRLGGAAASAVATAAGAIAPAAEVLRFELLALRELGYLPTLEECVECGRPVAADGRVAFGLLSGGVLCRDCRPGKRQVVSLSRQSWQTLVAFARPDEAWRQTPLSREVRGEVRGAMGQFIAGIIGHEPQVAAYLER
ncbi:MAG: DNA repair protein RecO [Planctomycetia bacterium]|nr:DNA repair protein RecO [Planctomycetia bacterium]